MTTSFSGRVLPWAARFRLVLPLAVAAPCLLLFFLGLVSPGVRSDPDLRPILWTLLVAGGAFVALWVILLATMGRRVTIDERGVRIAGRAPIDLGIPRRVDHGRHDRAVAYGRGAARNRKATHLWVAVEGADGRVVVFQRVTGAKDRLPDWPTALPPASRDVFDGAVLDFEALHAAAVRAMP